MRHPALPGLTQAHGPGGAGTHAHHGSRVPKRAAEAKGAVLAEAEAAVADAAVEEIVAAAALVLWHDELALAAALLERVEARVQERVEAVGVLGPRPKAA